MTLKEAYAVLPIGHALREATNILSSDKAPVSPMQDAERQTALRYLRAFQLLAAEFGLVQKAPELGDIGRELSELSRRVAALQSGKTER
jgi:hypothetical protein